MFHLVFCAFLGYWGSLSYAGGGGTAPGLVQLSGGPGRGFVETAKDLGCVPVCVSRTIPVVLLNFDIWQKELIMCKHTHLVFDGRLTM